MLAYIAAVEGKRVRGRLYYCFPAPFLTQYFPASACWVKVVLRGQLNIGERVCAPWHDEGEEVASGIVHLNRTPRVRSVKIQWHFDTFKRGCP
jgi:hypothetical protein